MMEVLKNVELEKNKSDKLDTDHTFREMTHLHMYSHASV